MLCTFCQNNETPSDSILTCATCQAKLDLEIEARNEEIRKEAQARHKKLLLLNRTSIYNKYGIPPIGTVDIPIIYDKVKAALSSLSTGTTCFSISGSQHSGKSTLGITLLDGIYLTLNKLMAFYYYPCANNYYKFTNNQIIEAVEESSIVFFDDIDKGNVDFITYLLKECRDYNKIVIVSRGWKLPDDSIQLILSDFGNSHNILATK